jgi:hypothetical protein
METIPQSPKKIIRYMGFSKFVWLISRCAIADDYFKEAVDDTLKQWGLSISSHRSALFSPPPQDPALQPLPE